MKRYSVMKTQLLIAGVGAIATACSTIEPADRYSAAATQPASGLVGPRSPDGPSGPAGLSGKPGADGIWVRRVARGEHSQLIVHVYIQGAAERNK